MDQTYIPPTDAEILAQHDAIRAAIAATPPPVLVVAPAGMRFKGRNGHAALSTAIVQHGGWTPDEMIIDFRSKRLGDGYGPSYLAGSPAAIVLFLEELLVAARALVEPQAPAQAPQEPT